MLNIITFNRIDLDPDMSGITTVEILLCTQNKPKAQNILQYLDHFVDQFGEDSLPSLLQIKEWLKLCKKNPIFKPTLNFSVCYDGSDISEYYFLQYIKLQ